MKKATRPIRIRCHLHPQPGGVPAPCPSPLKDQTNRPLEILVVDQSTRPLPRVRAYLQGEGQDIRHLTLSPPSTTAARNLAIRETRGEIVLFLDDDVLFQPDLIRHHLENLLIPPSGP